MNYDPSHTHAQNIGPPVVGLNDRPLLLVIEGLLDAEFLKNLSAPLSDADPSLPNLKELEAAGRLVFVPFGGGDLRPWRNRFQSLGCPELHLYDRETEPETALRLAAAEAVNQRAGCRALVTRKRALENYLHPEAIAAAGGPRIEIDDDISVPQAVIEATRGSNAWLVGAQRSYYVSRRRLLCRVKRWLNRQAAARMTAEMLAERDPAGEVRGWLSTAVRLLDGARR